MNLLNVLPVAMMVASFAAGVILLKGGWYGSGLYWLAASVINFAVIYGIKNWG